ncbi:MAG: DUF4102 domain-containing protein [Betaproteobacteria bacterium]|nr:DUF4102 domain-containing protein [Betaproteobacteria bacterium]
MALTNIAINKAAPKDKPYKLSDTGGLFLYVTPAGGKSWRWKYRVNGKEKTMTFGLYPDIGLAQARDLHAQARREKAMGSDPMVERMTTKLVKRIAADNSFSSVALSWHEQWKSARNERHADYVLRRLQSDVFPIIGARPISEIQAIELVGMVKKIAARGALDIAKRSYQTCGQVFRYAVAHGLAQTNPIGSVKPSDILPSRKTENFARISALELPDLMRQIEAYQGAAITRLAMKLMALTFVRTSELIGAKWAEFDFEKEQWRIPASRMKMKTEHIVPLAPQTLEVLLTLKFITGHSKLLFPGERDHEKSMSNNTILAALKRMGYGGRMTGHGFRGVASTLLHEQGFEHEHIELQLAHMERNAVSAAYNHAKYLKHRTEMMKAWAKYLEKISKTGVVQELRAA